MAENDPIEKPAEPVPAAAGCPMAGQTGTGPDRPIQDRSISILYVLMFYGFLGGCAVVWIHFTEIRSMKQLFSTDRILYSVSLGVGLGLACVALSWLALRHFSWAQALEEEFGWMLGEQRRWEVAVMAAVSGAAEELFFRGAMQPHLGLWLTSAVFGLIHFPINERYRGWPVFAFMMGLLMGWELRITGTLWAPILTHATVNFCNLWRLVGKYGNLHGVPVASSDLNKRY